MIKLIKGDCLKKMKDIESGSVDLILTDPPYWHKKSPGKPYSERKQYNTNSKFANSSLFNVEGDMMSKMSDFNGDKVEIIMNEFKRLQNKMNAYIFCNDTLLPYYGMWAERNKKHFSVLIWEKPLSIINKNRFSQHIEYIVRIYDYGTALNKLEDNFLYSKVKKYSQVRGKSKMHPTQKPIELLKEIILVSSLEGSLILDPFMGSGSTGVTCVNTNRSFIGIEMDDKYFEIAKNRINKKEGI